MMGGKKRLGNTLMSADLGKLLDSGHDFCAPASEHDSGRITETDMTRIVVPKSYNKEDEVDGR